MAYSHRSWKSLEMLVLPEFHRFFGLIKQQVCYLSSTSTIWNVVMGLSREELVEAVGKQMRNLTFSSCILRLLPPLIINENIAHRIVSILDKALHTGIAAEIDRKVLLARNLRLPN